MFRGMLVIALLCLSSISAATETWEPQPGWEDIGTVQGWMDTDALFRRTFQPKDILAREKAHIDFQEAYTGTGAKWDFKRFPPVDLQAWAGLLADEKEERRKLARDELSFVVRFRHRVEAVQQATRTQKYSGYSNNLVTDVDALGKCLSRLETAVCLDPTSPHAWHLLSYFSRCVGDLNRARKALAGTQAALDLLPPSALMEIRIRVALDRAWLHYDLGDYNPCLNTLHQARDLGAAGLEPQLLQGLVSARMGHFFPAKRVAASLHTVMIKNWNVALDLDPKVQAPVDNVAAWKERPSGFAEDWIMAIAWLTSGQPRMAAQELSPPNPYDIYPLAWRYFSEVGEIYLATGEQEKALLAWGMAFQYMPYLVYFPATSYAYDLSNLDLPPGPVPYFLGFDRFFLCGSNLAYGSSLVPQVRSAEAEEDRQRLAALALDRLEISQKKGLLPGQAAVVQSQVFYLMDDREAALAKLNDSIELLAEHEQDDRFSGLRRRLIPLKGNLRADFLSVLHSQSGASQGRVEEVVDPEEHLILLQAAYDADPNQDNRLALARGHVRCGQPEIGREVLLEGIDPGGTSARKLAELSPEMLLLVLEADRGLGRTDLALELVEGLENGWADDLDLVDIWAMAGFICLDHDLREAGQAALARAVILDPTNRGLQLQLNLLDD